jgi:NADH-quinone oxidoreductase subunit I
MNLQMGIFKDIKALISGMGIAGKHLGRHAITIQYPEQKWEMPERSRGMVVLLSDKETGELNCTGCVLCEKACPTSAINIDAPRDPETKKREVKSFTLDHALCCYCGLCEEACNFSAIKLVPKYEYSTENKDDLFWDKDKLQEMGRDAKYESKKKKKNEDTGDDDKPVKAEAKKVKSADSDVKAEKSVNEIKETKVEDNKVPPAPLPGEDKE